MEFLRSRRCDEVQGYYFSKPLSAVDAELFMRLDQIELRAEVGSTRGLRLLERPVKDLVGGA
jgi:hypothetical protein